MPNNDEPIRGKIAQIVTHTNAVINRGSRHGVKKDMRFIVRLHTGTIVDPDDPNNTLDELSFTKARLKVTTVFDGMSYCTIESTGLSFPSLPLVDHPAVEQPLFSHEDWCLRMGDVIEEIVYAP